MSYKYSNNKFLYQIESPVFNDSITSNAQTIASSDKGCCVLHSSTAVASTSTITNFTNADIDLTTAINLQMQHFAINTSVCKDTSIITDKSGDGFDHNSTVSVSKIANANCYIAAIVRCESDLTAIVNAFAVLNIHGQQNGSTSITTKLFKSKPRSLSTECKVTHLVDDLYDIRFGYDSLSNISTLYSARLGLITVNAATGSNINFTLHDLAIGFNLT